MILYPAIDLKEGKCVRLYQGDMAKATVFNDAPQTQALAFEEAGFSWLHLVDLDGAVGGKPANSESVTAILNSTSLKLQLGGGIRDIATIGHWLNAGLTRVILGTLAVTDPLIVREACQLFPGRIAVGIDAKDGKVATQGWTESSGIDAIELGKRFEDAGVAAIIYTDIARDGTMQGVNVEATAALADALTIPVIASGGVASIEDIRKLKIHAEQGIEGAIIGRALYEGKIDVQEALNVAYA